MLTSVCAVCVCVENFARGSIKPINEILDVKHGLVLTLSLLLCVFLCLPSGCFGGASGSRSYGREAKSAAE